VNCKSTAFAVTENASIMFLSEALCELQAVQFHDCVLQDLKIVVSNFLYFFSSSYDWENITYV